MHRQKGTPNIPQAVKEEIVSKHNQGATVRELAEEYGKTFKTIKGLIYRENLKRKGSPKQRGRKPAVTLQEYKYECARLRMENELLRDFLHLAGRK